MKRYRFYPVTAGALLDAAREAEGLITCDAEAGLARNACLLSRAVYRGGKRAFSSGEEVLRTLTAETVACWTKAYCALLRPSEPSDLDRLRWRVLRTFGVLPTERRAKRLTADDLRRCALQFRLDDEEKLRDVCPQCREELLSHRCPVCGAARFEENPNFDPRRFEELKANDGLSDAAAEEAGRPLAAR